MILASCRSKIARLYTMSAHAVVPTAAKTAIDPTREFTWNAATESKHYTLHTKPHKFATPEEERAWARTQTKTCSKCKQLLPLSYFNGNTSGADPFDRDGYRLRRPECRTCTKEAGAGKAAACAAAKRLGMSAKAPAGTPCELCASTDRIVFDHDHVTNTFRGWLCDPCNRSMGVLGDSVEGLLRALNYLNKSTGLRLQVDSSGTVISAARGAPAPAAAGAGSASVAAAAAT
jgi:hypothetical protein